MYRYRTLILATLVGILVNIIAVFSGSLFLKTLILELSLLGFFLALFAKRHDKKVSQKEEEHDSLKIHIE